MQNSLLKPRIIDVEALGAGHAKVVMEPFERGYGHTLGNALRRVLLSSMVGYAPTEVTIAGVVHDGPTFVMATFPSASDRALSMFQSNDGVTFAPLASEAYRPAGQTLRDPAIIRHNDGGYYVVYRAGATIALARSRDLKHWDFVREVPLTLPGNAQVQTPKWLQDLDGKLKLIVSSASGGAYVAITYRPSSSAISSARSTLRTPEKS